MPGERMGGYVPEEAKTPQPETSENEQNEAAGSGVLQKMSKKIGKTAKALTLAAGLMMGGEAGAAGNKHPKPIIEGPALIDTGAEAKDEMATLEELRAIEVKVKKDFERFIKDVKKKYSAKNAAEIIKMVGDLLGAEVDETGMVRGINMTPGQERLSPNNLKTVLENNEKWFLKGGMEADQAKKSGHKHK